MLQCRLLQFSKTCSSAECTLRDIPSGIKRFLSIQYVYVCICEYVLWFISVLDWNFFQPASFFFVWNCKDEYETKIENQSGWKKLNHNIAPQHYTFRQWREVDNFNFPFKPAWNQSELRFLIFSLFTWLFRFLQSKFRHLEVNDDNNNDNCG